MVGKLIVGVLALTISTGTVWAESTTTALQFPSQASATSVSGSVHAGDSSSFTLTATAGQVLVVSIISNNAANHFRILGPGGATPLFDGATQGKAARLTLPESGSYTVQGYLAADAAGRGETGRFTLDIALEGAGSAAGAAPAATTPTPAPAATATAATAPAATATTTVAAGSPEFWQVTGITGPLNLRQSSSRSATVLAGVPAGTRLRNLGCTSIKGQGWCQVQTVQGTPVTAWAAQQYLRPDQAGTPAAAAPATSPTPKPATGTAATAAATRPLSTALSSAARPQPRPSSVATPAPTNKPADNPAMTEASGKLPCSVRLGMPTRDCDFRVTREGRGQATITVTWPSDGQRQIRFEAGRPVVQAGSTTERRGDLTVINIGPERYEIPDAVVFGG